jgi:MoaA/NifB/PqqE/SkfB family radical SAM enzyme
MQTQQAGPPTHSPQELSFLWLELTSKCNLHCVHCYADSGPSRQLVGTMATEDWLTVLRDSREHGCEQVQFIGGEPTLHPDLPTMISFAAKLGYSFIEVYTNATRLSNELLEVFVDCKVRVAISFYSDDPVTHDHITNGHGSFDRTVHNVRRMLSAGLQIRAGIIEMAEYENHSKQAEGFLRQLGIEDIKVDFKRGVGRGAPLVALADPMAELCGECWKGKICVTNTGKTHPCVFSRFADLGCAKTGILDILSSDGLRDCRRIMELRWSRPNSIGLLKSGCDPCNPPVFPQPEPRCLPMEITQRSIGTFSDCSPCNPPPFKKCRP